MSMIFITFFFIIGCTILRCIEMNNNDFTFPQAYLWLHISVVVRSQCSTPGSSLRTKKTLGSLLTISQSQAVQKITAMTNKVKIQRLAVNASTTILISMTLRAEDCSDDLVRIGPWRLSAKVSLGIQSVMMASH